MNNAAEKDKICKMQVILDLKISRTKWQNRKILTHFDIG